MSVSARPILNPLVAALGRHYGWTALALVPGLALAGPVGEQVAQGTVAVARPDANTTTVTQSSNGAVVNWHSFSVDGQEYVQFVQPGANAAILNRVTGGNASQILGRIDANGRVFLVNPQGVYFGSGAKVDTAGFAASTLDIKDEDFMQGRYVFAKGTGAPDAGVTNAGELQGDQFVVLMGDRVANEGLVQARLGSVALAAGRQVSLQLDDSGLVSFAIDEATAAAHAGVENTGEIVAGGGRVLMTAKVANELVATAVNNAGLVRAVGIDEAGGDIFLRGSGGKVVNSGTLDASGTQGGRVIVASATDDVEIRTGAVVAAAGAGEGDGGAIRLIAKQSLTVEAGAAIDARGGAEGGEGGFVELSAHEGTLQLDGGVQAGDGGEVVIDPARLAIGANASGPGGDSTLATVGKGFIEGLLNSNTDVTLVAHDEIFATGGPFTITASGTGDLALRIGNLVSTDSGSFAGAGFYGSGCGSLGVCVPNGDFNFSPDPAGNINLSGIGINIRGMFTAAAGSSAGNVTLGAVAAAGIEIYAGFSSGNITLGGVSVSNASSGASLELNAPGGRVDINGPVSVAATGTGLESDAFALAQITARRGISVNGQIAVSGRHGAILALQNGPYGSGSGDVVLRGNISAKSPDLAYVYVENPHGRVEFGGTVLAQGPSNSQSPASIFVEAGAGGVRTAPGGLLSAPMVILHSVDGGAIDVRTNSPDITVAASGSASPDVSIDNTAHTGATVLRPSSSLGSYGSYGSYGSDFGRSGFDSFAELSGGFFGAVKVAAAGDLVIANTLFARNALIEVTNGSLAVQGSMIVGDLNLSSDHGDRASLLFLSRARRPDGAGIPLPRFNGAATAGPNAVFRAQNGIEFAGGLVFLDPDTPYVIFMTDGKLDLGPGVYSESSIGNEFLAQFTSFSPQATIHVEDSTPLVPFTNGPTFTNAEHFSKLPGTTMIVGNLGLPGGPHTGGITIGRNGVIDIGDQNILFSTTGRTVGIGNIRSTGFIGEVITRDALRDVFATPLVNEFDEEDRRRSGTYAGAGEEGGDGDDQLIAQKSNTGQMCE